MLYNIICILYITDEKLVVIGGILFDSMLI